MIELKALKCQCCGGPINRETMKCSFCGTEYIIKDDTLFIRFETFQNPVKTLRAQCRVSNLVFNHTNQKEYMEFCLHQLARELAENMYDCMKIRTDDDEIYGDRLIRAEVRVVQPVQESMWENMLK